MDHRKKARQIQIELFRNMSAERKLELTMQLYNDARLLKAAAFRKQHPDWTERQIDAAVREVFLHARS